MLEEKGLQTANIQLVELDVTDPDKEHAENPRGVNLGPSFLSARMSGIGRLVDIALHQNQHVLSAAQDQAQRLSPQLNRLSGNAVDKLHPALRFTRLGST